MFAKREIIISKKHILKMSDVLAEYERLTQEKAKLEAEIQAIADELTSGHNAPGLKGPLVDAEGFPRADIDVYRVRHQRHNFACLQTDHKTTMAAIEQLLPKYVNAGIVVYEWVCSRSANVTCVSW